MMRAFMPLLQGLGLAKSAVYFLEGMPLAAVHRALQKSPEPPPPEFTAALTQHALDMIRQDAQNLALGFTPARVLLPVDWYDHWPNYLRILGDNVRVGMRKL